MKYNTYENPFDEFIKVETVIQEPSPSVSSTESSDINTIALIAIVTFVIAAIIAVIYILWKSNQQEKEGMLPYNIQNYFGNNNYPPNNNIPYNRLS
jgi:hypothetical protein